MIVSYLKPWRRRIGIAVLVFACLFLTEWVRSLAMIDSANYARGGTGYRLESVDGRVELWINRDAQIDVPIRIKSTPLGNRRLIDEEMLKRKQATKRRLDALHQKKASLPPTQFAEFESRAKNALHAMEPWCKIPYWTIVVPLTILSTFLLLSKRRTPNPSEFTGAPAS